MSFQSEKSSPDYLVIGHITRDLVEGGSRPGGTVLYSGITAQRMGLHVAMFTSCPEDLLPEEVDDFEIINQPTKNITTFKNIYSSSGREQYLVEKAQDLDISLVPENWKKVKIIQLGPVVGEINPEFDQQLLSFSICYSLQGWLRDWDENGKIHYIPPEDINLPEGIKTAAFLSIEDLGNNRETIDQLRKDFPFLVLTKGYEGAEIFLGEEIFTIMAEPAIEKDPTGAGDIFAAAFIIYWVLREKSIVESAELASKFAAISVTRPGLKGIPTVEEIREIEEKHNSNR